MKKLVLMFVAIAAISFASCGNKTQQAATATDSDSVCVDTVAIETVEADTLMADSAAVADSTVAAEAPVAE